MDLKVLIFVILSTATLCRCGFVPGNYVFHHNPRFPVYTTPKYQYQYLTYPYPAPIVQYQWPSQIHSFNRPEKIVAIHSASQPPSTGQQPFDNIVAIHAPRPKPSEAQWSIPVENAQQQQQEIPPQYSFKYAVKDATTGDEKSHQEARTGDNVVGHYTVVEPDGNLRKVSYTAGKSGFNAKIENTPGYAPPNDPALISKNKFPQQMNPQTTGAVAVPVAGSSNYNYPYSSGFHFGG